MIVGCFFKGDEDDEVTLKQHSVYHEALAIVVGTCTGYTEESRRTVHQCVEV